MIYFFNRIGNSWVAKIIFFLLGVSMMAFWGLGGISNTDTSDGSALQVGDRKVSMQELGHTFDQERNKLAKISGGYMTPKRALEAGLLDRVIQQLASRELNVQIQEELGLTASDKAVRKYIENSPLFSDNLGKFDANLFYAYLSQMNLSQSLFAHQMRSELAMQHLHRTLAQMMPRNASLMDRAARAQKEKKEVLGVLLTPEKIKVSVPDTQELKDYYEAYMEEFSTPEYRTLRVVSLKPEDFKNDYDQMTSASHQLEDLLGEGKTLSEAATELKLNPGKVFVVDFTGLDQQGKKQESVVPFLQEAFALNEGEATSIMDFDGKMVVAGVEKIVPHSYKKFDSVKAQVLELWQREQQKEAVSKLANELLASVQSEKGWKSYTPKTYILTQQEEGKLPRKLVYELLQRQEGSENALSLTTDEGVWVAYVKRIIPFKGDLSENELQEAIQGISADLADAVQQVYLEKYPVTIHQNKIQKAFSVYDKQED